MTAPLDVHRVGDIVRLTLATPRRKNALSLQVLGALSGALRDLGTDIAGVLLTGGPDIFSAGADFADLTGTVADIAVDDAVADVADAIAAAPVPVIAAIEGPCMGAAVHLALTCDARIIGESGYLQVPAVRLGLLYNPEAVRWLSANYPRDSVRRMLVIGERFGAQDAQRAGLVSRVVPAGEAATQAATMLAALSPEHRRATAYTRALLHEAESAIPDPDERWQRRRRELLDSPARAQAVAQARRKHLHHNPSDD
ncbi:enoyl-CoA hydratase/carnithine racemase [Gordonia amarae]|uniref:Putative enoyl-CoA hydratase n=1 Tax=Gordonia amarae NBRC 15530 TaxID=1075090 RepID=G7GNQ9_9ACTN|nr:enoyl-CoA hydratase/isomerase family protein [Gordonia amarae]MCS3878180.1 enoyl-CoA hydratase/carnithine racemase [Gordonia amarae]GAB05234.1 putative enoyl-CoA hydratase [Gordonia amarae NBRC 15530]